MHLCATLFFCVDKSNDGILVASQKRKSEKGKKEKVKREKKKGKKRTKNDE